MDVQKQVIGTKTMAFAAVITAASIAACSLPSDTTTEAAATASKPFSNGEILQVLETLNAGEVKQAQLAQRKATDEDVREAAELIIEDHRRSNERITRTAEIQDFKLEESPLSRGLEAQANEIHEELAELSGQEFNCAYLQKQVELHSLALDTVTSDLLPDADAREVRELLSQSAPSLEQHREAARQTIASLPDCEQPDRG